MYVSEYTHIHTFTYICVHIEIDWLILKIANYSMPEGRGKRVTLTTTET